MSGFFFNLGRQIGRSAIPAIRKSKWIWDDLTGSEEAALRAERALGMALSVQLRHSTERVADPGLAKSVNQICKSLAAASKDPRRSFNCELYRDEQLNAMALPGGFIFLTSSMVELCQKHELAFVIGHEMAHVILGHARERMLNQTALRAASRIVSRTGPLGAWLKHQGMQLLQSAYSKMWEFEADDLGLRLSADAGFDPKGAIRLLERIENLGPAPDQFAQYFASHPPASDRIARLRPLCH